MLAWPPARAGRQRPGRIVAAQVRPYRLRWTRPMTTAQGTFVRRQGQLLWLRDEAGRWGVGDAAAWPGFGASGPQVAAATADACERLVGQPLALWRPDAPQLPATDWPSATLCAIETAAWDLWAQAAGEPAACLWPGAAHQVACHRLVRSASEAQAWAARGALALKLKVGGRPLAEDLLQVAAVRAAVGPRLPLVCDANGAWPLPLALRAARQLCAFSPLCLEQPVAAADLDGLRQLRQLGGIEVAADEALVDGAAQAQLVSGGVVDAVVIKPMVHGGLGAARRLAAAAAGNGVRVVMTHLFESAVGRLATRHLAASLPSGGVHGLAAGAGQADVAPLPLEVGPQLGLRPGPHFGLQLESSWLPRL